MTEIIQTYVLVLMGLSAVVGAGAMLLIRIGFNTHKRRQKQEDYNPWGPGVTHYEEPMLYTTEAPISARKK